MCTVTRNNNNNNNDNKSFKPKYLNESLILLIKHTNWVNIRICNLGKERSNLSQNKYPYGLLYTNT